MVFMHSDKFEHILNELQEQTDRGSAIIGSAITDDLLTAVLQQRLILNKTLQDRLFSYEKNGPLASFSSKIDVAFAVGLIPARMRNDLHLVRRIRNRFAHLVDPLKFSDAKIAAFCGTLSHPEQKIETPRTRFMMTCQRLIG